MMANEMDVVMIWLFAMIGLSLMPFTNIIIEMVVLYYMAVGLSVVLVLLMIILSPIIIPGHYLKIKKRSGWKRFWLGGPKYKLKVKQF